MDENTFKNIDEALDIEEGEFDNEEENSEQYPVVSSSRELEEIDRSIDSLEDYEKTRQTMHFLLEKGQEALDKMIQEAKTNGKARDYEVVSHMIRSISETGKDLLDIQKKINEQEKQTPSNEENSGNKYEQNNYYMTREELMREINEAEEEEGNES